jgi:outer membrane protein TolC
MKSARGSLRPKINLYADARHTDFFNSYDVLGYPRSLITQRYNTADIGVKLSFPVFQGGIVAAIRQAEAEEGRHGVMKLRPTGSY